MESLYAYLNNLGYTHPLHPPWTYLPMGLILGALVFRLVALLPGGGKFAVTARHCLTLAFAAVFPTILFGYFDWQHFYAGRWMFPVRMKLALAAVLLLLLLFTVMSLYRRLPAGDLRIFGCHVLCFLVIVGIGYYGGELVFGTPRENAGEKEKPAAGFAGVRSILERHCTSCHSGSDPPMGLRLDSHAALMAGGSEGPVVVPGRPSESELVKRIRGTSEPRMPLGRPPLPEADIGVITEWIREGTRG